MKGPFLVGTPILLWATTACASDQVVLSDTSNPTVSSLQSIFASTPASASIQSTLPSFVPELPCCEAECPLGTCPQTPQTTPHPVPRQNLTSPSSGCIIGECCAGSICISNVVVPASTQNKRQVTSNHNDGHHIAIIVEKGDAGKEPVTIFAEVNLQLQDNYVTTDVLALLDRSAEIQALGAGDQQVLILPDGTSLPIKGTVTIDLIAGHSTTLFQGVKFGVLDAFNHGRPELALGTSFLAASYALTIDAEYAGDAVDGVTVLIGLQGATARNSVADGDKKEAVKDEL